MPVNSLSTYCYSEHLFFLLLPAICFAKLSIAEWNVQYLFKFIKATGFPLKDARLSNKLQSSIRSGILVNFEKRETLYWSWIQHENHICRILLLLFCEKDIYVSISVDKKGILYLCLCIPIHELFLTVIIFFFSRSYGMVHWKLLGGLSVSLS